MQRHFKFSNGHTVEWPHFELSIQSRIHSEFVHEKRQRKTTKEAENQS